jgi:transcription initiation factor IIE alpha subunit
VSAFFDSQDFSFTCPNCKRSVKTTVAEPKRSNYKCPGCGAIFDSADFKRGVDRANCEVDQLKRRLRNIKIDIKL